MLPPGPRFQYARIQPPKNFRDLPRYLRELRIRHALFLMEQGVASVKNVALLSGFGDALYFSKVFTAEQGISPKAYIASIHGESET